MTKQGIVDQVYLFVNGGEASPDVKISREEIAHLLPSAISYALTVLVRTESKEAKEDFRIYGTIGDSYGNSVLSFLLTEILPVKKDEDRDLYYIPLSKRVLNLPGNRGLCDVSPMQNLDASYVKVGSRLEIIGIPLGGTTFYWYESPQKIYFKNIGLPICDHLVRYVADFDSYANGEDLPIPGDFEFEIIRLLCDFFTNERKNNADDIPNDKDEKS